MPADSLNLYLKKQRLKSGLTQSQVAEMLGYSNSQFVSNWERGKCLPAVSSLKELSSIFGIPFKELFDMYMNSLRTELLQKAEGSKNGA